LRKWLPDRSWSEIRRLIESRHIVLNGNACTDAGRRLQASDVVQLLPQPSAAPPAETDIRVHYLDEHLVVVEKPAGMTTNRHRDERDWPRRRKQIQPTLDEMVPHLIVKIEGRRNRRGVPVPVRAVHRIDRDTSGLVVFARTHNAERILAQQFRQHATHRRYLAIVEGQVKAQTISSRLLRDRGDGRRGSTSNPDLGKLAITHVQPLETLPHYTLLQCRLETGRTHQIRIHLAELGHPVCGDCVYGNQKQRQSPAPRLALHAAELGLVHPVTGKPLRFQAPLPRDLAEFWRGLHSTVKE
jgi:23S rRNA pseudouridine1911/1915/1917 synthase